MIKVVVFDFDGTLIDSSALKSGAYFDVLPKTPQARKAVERITQQTGHIDRYSIMRALLPELKALGELDYDHLETAVSDYAARYGEAVKTGMTGVKAMPDAYRVLAQLEEKYTLYLNSATPTAPLRQTAVAFGMTRYFKDIVGTPPDKTSNLKLILEREAVKPESTVVIGDGRSDFEAALAVGTHFIALQNSLGDLPVGDYLLARELKNLMTLIRRL